MSGDAVATPPASGGPSPAPSGPLLSVVMPTHDVRPWLPQALESVLRQDVDGMEVIVVDDHSTDGTPELVADVAARDGRVRLVRAESAGGGSARNRGVEEARGRYLVFCDGDDLVPDGAYRALLDSLERSGSDLAVGDYLKFRAVHTWRPTDAMPAFDRAAQGIAVRDEPTLLFSRPCWNRAFRRSFWDRAGISFPDVPRSNDIVPMVTAYLAAARIDVVPDVVYVYRERPGDGSMSARATAAASLLSYLDQETACAAAVEAAGDRGLSRAYGALVWDRDGYVHVARHVLTRRRAQGDDAAIAAALRGLLARTAEPESGIGGELVHPLRRLAMVLAARGELAASGTVVRLLETDPSAEVQGDEAIDDWTLLLDRLSDPSLVRDDARELLAERFARQATAPHSAAAAVRWRALVRAARRVLGERALMFSPEARASVPGDAQRARRRAGMDARVERVSGGSVLVLSGTIAADDVSGRWRPVLFDGLRAAEGAPVIEAAEVAWTEARDGRLAWSARFPAGALPMHRPLRPAVAAPGTGEVLAMGGPAAPPAYEPRDRFLYDRIDGVLVVRRRRHWAPRALRRAAIVALRRLRPPR